MTYPTFAVTWDYLCPFARNVHEHLVAGLEAGAPWDVTFTPFSLVQAHVEEGGTPVWDDPEKARGVLALEAGIVVRDRFPELFPQAHRALFATRHTEGGDLRDAEVLRDALKRAGAPAQEVFEEIERGWPRLSLRAAHEQAVAEHSVFGVPTFIVGDRAAFVRVMNRPGGDGDLARSTIEGVLDLIVGRPELNELKHTTVPR